MSSAQQFLAAIERPRCPRCETRMMLERVSRGPHSSEHRLFECPKCDQVEIIVFFASDPLNRRRPVGLPENSERRAEANAMLDK